MNEQERLVELYFQNISKGMDQDEAYTEAYSVICNAACEQNGTMENGDGSLD